MVLVMNKNTVVKMGTCLLGVYVVFGLVHYVVLGGAHKIKLPPAPPLVGQIEQVLRQNSDGSLKKNGVDFSLNSQYFENKTWVVVDIQGLRHSQSGYVIMKKNDGVYQVISGPGTALASTQLSAFPEDVSGYLTTRLTIYNPIPGQTSD